MDMFRKMAWVVVACGFAAAVAACAGPTGKGEGDSCTGADDCSSNLTCQPISGRQGDFCCPTPASSSKEGNCQSASTDGG
ncbi:MAG TPA: hypothetical protein VIF15_14390 [Polyangiaceae bacterium]|jgi:hypothetical protein